MNERQPTPVERHINPSGFTNEQLSDYQLAIQARIAELAIYNTDCENEWQRRFPSHQ